MVNPVCDCVRKMPKAATRSECLCRYAQAISALPKSQIAR